MNLEVNFLSEQARGPNPWNEQLFFSTIDCFFPCFKCDTYLCCFDIQV